MNRSTLPASSASSKMLALRDTRPAISLYEHFDWKNKHIGLARRGSSRHVPRVDVSAGLSSASGGGLGAGTAEPWRRSLFSTCYRQWTGHGKGQSAQSSRRADNSGHLKI